MFPRLPRIDNPLRRVRAQAPIDCGWGISRIFISYTYIAEEKYSDYLPIGSHMGVGSLVIHRAEFRE